MRRMLARKNRNTWIASCSEDGSDKSAIYDNRNAKEIEDQLIDDRFSFVENEHGRSEGEIFPPSDGELGKREDHENPGDVSMVRQSQRKKYIKWTQEEDKVLLEGVNEMGGDPLNWTYISSKVPNRTAKQCKDRWFCCLIAPERAKKWTEEDEFKCFVLQKVIGNKWMTISKAFSNKSCSDLAKHWKILKQKLKTFEVRLNFQLDKLRILKCKIVRYNYLRQETVKLLGQKTSPLFE